jgi:3,4-dihydroxy 2-butanone 4-phosphate synthase/GTP cyclohydrolase II
VQPGHVFPLQAQDGGVLMRAGHTEAGCDLARMAGLSPAAVICEIMNDDGTMARLPQLEAFCAHHGLKIGTIADLIHYRSRNESLVERMHVRPLDTPWGRFESHAFQDRTGGVHLALTVGRWQADDDVLVRVHEPVTVLDLLDAHAPHHSWPLPHALATLQRAGRGVAVLLNCGQEGAAVLAEYRGSLPYQQAAAMDLRTYGVGAQILRELGVARMRLLGQPRRMPSMAGYGLEVSGYLGPDEAAA